MNKYSIGIDIGGTKIAAGIVNSSGKVLIRKNIPTPQENRDGIFVILRQLIHSLTLSAKDNGWELTGIGVGTAGQVDFQQGRVLSGTANIADWNDVPVRDELAKFTVLPVWIDNDVNVVALAEHHLGVAQGESNIVCITLGTGVGGGVISDGRLIRGAWGGASELGHISVHMDGPLCNCGFRGCLETYASGTGIANIMREKLADSSLNVKNSAFTLYKQDPKLITSQLVFQWMKEGDPIAIAVIREMITALSFGIVSFIHTFNPTMIVLGGGVMKEGMWIRDEVGETVRTLGIRSLVDPVKIEIAKLGAEAGMVGAAYQSWLYGN